MSQYYYLINPLRSLLGILELEPTSLLYQDTIAICNYLENPRYRIAVFAPFNHGKSTLLNALLGNKTLPMDLIPTTGVGIIVGYGTELMTEINFKDGTKIVEAGVNLLQQYAVLESEPSAEIIIDRKIKPEVLEVKVFCDHPWLKTGIEFLDLPGTNDREQENELVRNQLPTADLIIHVLDARKLMTLEEREHLRDWLENRGIKTVIFVVNFLNLLTQEEQQEVKQRLCFIAESFRSSLPVGISNIYCVDALPALRARLKGNEIAAKATGITSLESALQTIISLNQSQKYQLPRVFKITSELLKQACFKQQQIQAAIAKQNQIKQKAAQLIQQGFQRSVSDFYGWLYLPKLLAQYQPSLAIALQETRFDSWLESEFKPEVLQYQQAINQWINQSCDFFSQRQPQLLTISFSDSPVISLPETKSNETENQATNLKSYLPAELNFLLPKKAGVVVLGGANYLVNKIVNKASEPVKSQISSQIYIDAAAQYLQHWRDRVHLLLQQYESTAQQYITFNPNQAAKNLTNADYQLELLNNLIDNLATAIQSLSGAE